MDQIIDITGAYYTFDPPISLAAAGVNNPEDVEIYSDGHKLEWDEGNGYFEHMTTDTWSPTTLCYYVYVNVNDGTLTQFEIRDWNNNYHGGEHSLLIRVKHPATIEPHFKNGVDTALSGYGLLVPAKTVFDGDITLTDSEMPIPFSGDADVSEYTKWKVTLSGHELVYSGYERTFNYEDQNAGIFYSIGDYSESEDWEIAVRNTNNFDIVPGSVGLRTFS